MQGYLLFFPTTETPRLLFTCSYPSTPPPLRIHLPVPACAGSTACFLQCFRRRRGEGGKDARDGAPAGELALWEMGVAGLFSGVATAPLRTTIERVKTVMQVI